MRSLLAVFLGLVIALTATLLALPPSPATAPVPAAPAAAPTPATPLPDPTLAGPPSPAQLARGARTYRSLCLACHLPDGKGMPGLVPPLAGADYLAADRTRAVQTVLKGLNAPIAVNGVSYRGLMPGLENVLTDAQVADVLTYVFNSWGNAGEAFAPDRIAALRAEWRGLAPVVAPPAAN